MRNANYAVRRERHITKAQIRAIKTLSNKVYNSDESYREALESFGVDSCTKLTMRQAAHFITKMSASVYKEPKRSRARYYGAGVRGEQRHLTPEQAKRIELFEDHLGWNSISIVNFIKKQTGKNKAVNMLANYEAVKVIVGMQKIAAAGDKVIYAKLNGMSNAELEEFINGGKICI